MYNGKIGQTSFSKCENQSINENIFQCSISINFNQLIVNHTAINNIREKIWRIEIRFTLKSRIFFPSVVSIWRKNNYNWSTACITLHALKYLIRKQPIWVLTENWISPLRREVLLFFLKNNNHREFYLGSTLK